jgi:hypothetical protein
LFEGQELTRCSHSWLYEADVQRLNSPALRGFITQRPVE